MENSMSTYNLNYTDSFGHGDANSSRSNLENGFNDLSSLSQSEKAVQELLTQQTPIQAIDDHLIEFSEALRTVAKALRGSAEGMHWLKLRLLNGSENIKYYLSAVIKL